MKKGLLIPALLLISFGVFAVHKHKLSGHYTNAHGFCSTILAFVNDSIYTCNYGCESAGHTYYGKYYIKSDSLFLHAGINDFKIQILKADTIEIESKNEIFELKFIDQRGQDLTEKFKAYYSGAGGNQYSLEYNDVSKCLVCRNTGANQSIKVITLEKLGLKDYTIKTDFPRKTRITYNLKIPEMIYQLDLFNKDLATTGNDTLIINDNYLTSFMDEVNFFDHTDSIKKIVYKKDNY